MRRSSLKTASVVLFIAGFLAGSAEAQIINTLRGFDDEERGWSGAAVGGVALAGGNTQYFELELDGKVQFQTERNRVRAIGIYLRRTAESTVIAKSRLGHLRHNYRIWSRFSSIAFLQGSHDPFLRVESRVLFGGGIRMEMFEGDLWKSAVGVTLMRESETLIVSSTEDATESNVPTEQYRFSCFLTLYRAEAKGVDIDLWGFYQPLVDDLLNARTSAAASVRVDVVGELYLLASYVIRNDSNPPAGVKKFDYSLRSGVGVRF